MPDSLLPYLWPGLASYQEQDRHLFYGRTGEIFDLTRKLLSSRLTILFGPSGAGKTSLLQAGIFPKLREQNLLPVLVRLDFPQPGEPVTPAMVQFEAALSRECKNRDVNIDYSDNHWFTSRKDQLLLWEWLRSFSLTGQSGAGYQPVFIFDQFEEIFTLGRNARGLESFIRQIGDAAENFMPEEISQLINSENIELPFDPAGQPYKMVITLRDDYLAQLQGLRQVLPGVTVRQNHFALDRLTGRQALEAITGPAPAGMITQRVATEIIRFVANASERTDEEIVSTDVSLDHLEVEPAILSLVCQQLDLKRQAQGEQSITVDFVKQSKGQILEDFYESAMHAVRPETRSFIEDHLLDAEGFRTSEPESNLLQHQVPVEDIRHLIDLRLLHRVEFYHRSHLELSHDVLAPVVKSSRDGRVQREEAVRREAEISQLKQQRRRSMALVSVFALITIFAMTAGYLSFRARQHAIIQERRAAALYLVSSSQMHVQKNTDQAICMAQLAQQIDSTVYSSNNILRIVYDNNYPLSRVILKGHRNSINSAFFSPDGQRIVTASVDSTARLWDLKGNPVAELKDHHNQVNFAVFSPDGQQFATTSMDSTARIWDLTGNLITVFKGHLGAVFHVGYSPDGNSIVTCSGDKTAKIWDLKGNLMTDLTGHRSYVYAAVFSPDGQLIATSSADTTARLWDINGKQIACMSRHQAFITSVAFSPDGKSIVTASRDGTAKLWDLKGNLITNCVENVRVLVNSAVFSPGGKRILAASVGTTLLWDLNGKLVTEFKGHRNVISSAVFSPDGHRILTCGDDNTAKLWDLSGNLVADLRGHKLDVISVAFSPDGKQILTASTDGTAKIWDTRGNLDADFVEYSNRASLTYAVLGWDMDLIHSAVLSPDGELFATSSLNGSVKLWDVNDNYLASFSGHHNLILSIAFSPGGERMVTSSFDGTAKIWDPKGNLIADLKGHRGPVYRAVFSPDGKRIVTTSADRTARLWDVRGNLIADLTGHTNKVISAGFSPDGKRILTGSWDHTAKVWDLEGKLIADLKGHRYAINSAVFSPDGKRIVTASDDQTARLWDLNGKMINELTGHSDQVKSAFFSPDGQRILTASSENIAKLWDLEGHLLADFIGHQGGLTTAVFSPDGQTIATASWDQTVKLWDTKGNPIADLQGHMYGVAYVAFSADGRRILTSSIDCSAKIWPGIGEILSNLSQNPHREKLTLNALAEIPIKVSKQEFEKAVRGNIVEGNYGEYRQLIKEEKGK